MKPPQILFEKGIALSALITAYFELPKRINKRFKELMLSGKLNPICKPDCNNIAKIILDALNNFLYHDDAQIKELQVYKKYGVKSGVVVTISDRTNTLGTL